MDKKRKYEVKQKYRQYSPTSLTNAYTIVKDGMSVRGASRQYNVPMQTLRDRILGKIDPECVTTGRFPIFSQEEEAQSVDHLKSVAQYGYVTRSEVTDISTEFAVQLHIRTTDNPLTWNWMDGFLKRWPELKVPRPRSFEIARAKSASAFVVAKYFTELKKIIHKYKLEDAPHHIFNVDEKGVSPNHTPLSVVGINGYRPPGVTRGKSETTTTIGCGSAAGTRNVNSKSISEDENHQEKDIALDILNEPRLTDEVTEIYDKDITHTESETEQNEPKTAASFFEKKLNTLKTTKARQNQKKPRQSISSIIPGKAITEEKTQTLIKEYEYSKTKKGKAITEEKKVTLIKEYENSKTKKGKAITEEKTETLIKEYENSKTKKGKGPQKRKSSTTVANKAQNQNRKEITTDKFCSTAHTENQLPLQGHELTSMSTFITESGHGTNTIYKEETFVLGSVNYTYNKDKLDQGYYETAETEYFPKANVIADTDDNSDDDPFFACPERNCLKVYTKTSLLRISYMHRPACIYMPSKKIVITK
ncbi:unnamed protein product [Mytilus coruscus]|uniref:HTH psq-type domain-containing protein n=1 Tax=Mytilus coruscus TaxID=42192 RepID=A0A6J8F1N6_MYTCO|nr:unnamed protein product [Mytilus coruscus]